MASGTALVHLEKERISDYVSSRALRTRQPKLRVEDPYGVCRTASINNLDALSQWYFSNQVDSSGVGHWTAVSTKAWGEEFWNLAIKNEVTFTYLMLVIIDKQAILTGKAKGLADLYQMQSRVIKLIQNGVRDGFKTAGPETALVICGLALFSLRDGDRETTRAHMTAVQTIARIHPYSPEKQPIWRLCSWMDLFVATACSWNPVLPYRLPSPSEKCTIPAHPRVEEARRESLKACKHIPHLAPEFGSHEAFQLLTKLHEICYTAEDREVVIHAPSNLLYDAIYELCQLSAKVKPHLQILVVAMQICWLSAAKYWVPQARPLWASLLVRLGTTLQSCPGIVASWQDEDCLTGLLWVALVAFQTAKQCMPGLSLRFVAIGRCVRELLKVSRLHDLRRLMAPFPGIPSYKDHAVNELWEAIRPGSTSQWMVTREEDLIAFKQKLAKDRQSKKFITIFQFEDLEDEGPPSCRSWTTNWGQNVEIE